MFCFLLGFSLGIYAKMRLEKKIKEFCATVKNTDIKLKKFKAEQLKEKNSKITMS